MNYTAGGVKSEIGKNPKLLALTGGHGVFRYNPLSFGF